LTAAGSYTHCPNCLAEYGTWSTTCLDCGSALVPGPSPAQEEQKVEPGRVEVIERGDEAAAGSPDRFALEEQPVVLTSMVEEDVGAFLVDDIAVDPEDGTSREMAVLTWTRLQDAGALVNRLRAGGVDVRMELPAEADRTSSTAQAAILVPVDELDLARKILGIEL
jgi:hypothetical protein